MRRKITSALLISMLSFSSVAKDFYENALSAYQKNEIDNAYIHLKNALAENSDNLAAHILMGQVLLKKGRFQDGITSFQDAMSLGADPNPFVYELARALLFIEDFDQVIALSQLKSLNNNNKVKTQLLASNAYLAMQKPALALAALEKAEFMAPEQLNIITSLTHYYLEQRDFSNAEEYLDKSLSLAPDNNRVWHLKGVFLNAQGKGAEALEAFKHAYQLTPQDPIVMRSLANQYYLLHQTTQALEFTNKILSETPFDTYVELLKSRLLIQSGQAEQAQVILKDISSKLSLITDVDKHNNPSIAYVSGTAAFLQGNFEQAQQDLIYYVNTKPEDLSGITMLVEIYQHQQQQVKVEALLERYEPRIKKDLHLALNLFNVYVKNKKSYKAKSLLDELERLFQHNLLITIARANYFVSVNRNDEAIALLEDNTPTPTNTLYQFSKANLYFLSNNLQKASELIDQLLEVDDNNIQLLTFKGVLLSKQGQWQQAISYFDRVLVADELHFQARYNKATALAAINRKEEASSVVNALAEQYANNLETQILKAKLNRDLGKLAEAEQQLKQILLKRPRELNAAEILYDVYMSSNQYGKALEEAERLNSNSFLNAKYIVLKANALIKQQKFNEANAQLGRLKGLAETANDFYQLSALQTATKDFNGALKSLDAALKQSPSNFLYQIEKAKLLLTLNQQSKTQEILDKLALTHSKNPNLQYAYGLYFARLNQLDKSFLAFTKAFSLDNSFTAPAVKMYMLAQQGVNQQVFESTLENALNNNNTLSYVRNLLADYYITQQRKNEALNHYLVLEGQPSFNKSSIYNNLANIYANKDINKSLLYIEKAIKLDSNSPAILDTYGWILALKGDYSLSLEKLRKAYAINANDPSICYHLGYTLAKLGRTQDAIIELNKALTMSKTFSEFDAAEALLSALSQ